MQQFGHMGLSFQQARNPPFGVGIAGQPSFQIVGPLAGEAVGFGIGRKVGLLVFEILGQALAEGRKDLHSRFPLCGTGWFWRFCLLHFRLLVGGRQRRLFGLFLFC
ncbi:MAG: hypothetical protein K6G31_05085 [Paludibacteraceae bacterium]|nr:hypothetical protein [Paludibacteraceae bacterium]